MKTRSSRRRRGKLARAPRLVKIVTRIWPGCVTSSSHYRGDVRESTRGLRSPPTRCRFFCTALEQAKKKDLPPRAPLDRSILFRHPAKQVQEHRPQSMKTLWVKVNRTTKPRARTREIQGTGMLLRGGRGKFPGRQSFLI